jgi:hypothetical protein
MSGRYVAVFESYGSRVSRYRDRLGPAGFASWSVLNGPPYVAYIFLLGTKSDRPDARRAHQGQVKVIPTASIGGGRDVILMSWLRAVLSGVSTDNSTI